LFLVKFIFKIANKLIILGGMNNQNYIGASELIIDLGN